MGSTLWAAAVAAERAPNFIVILVDDLGWADLGHDGSRIDTPHLDRLAQQGVKLTHFRSSAPMCSPTRAALLTGRYPHSVGVPELASPDARGNVPILALDQAAITLPEALRPAGYRSTLIGKWHLGFYKENWPHTHGFDEFWGSLIGTPTFWHARETYHNETPITVPGYYTDELATRAIASLRRDAAEAKPFFHYLAFNAPHYPLEAPFELVSKYRKRFPDRGLFAIYAAMVEHLDTALGRIFAALDELHLAENTLVVFMSDNGPTAELNSYGPEGADFSNGPHRGYKFGTTEGGLRVPFLARWPGKIPAGTVHVYDAGGHGYGLRPVAPPSTGRINKTPPSSTANGNSCTASGSRNPGFIARSKTSAKTAISRLKTPRKSRRCSRSTSNGNPATTPIPSSA